MSDSSGVATVERVLLLGAHGMLGSELAAGAPVDVALRAADHADLDITHPDAVAAALDELRPDVVLNAAAYTRVDDAEREIDAALRVNATAVGELGRACAARGIRVVHFGTDYVFDGRSDRPYAEDAPTSPVNRYGESKLRGERALLESAAEALVIRTQWLFGVHGRSFPRTMWQRARAGQPTRVVADQTGRPTYTRDLADAVWRLVSRRMVGVVHATNAGRATWYDVARVVFDAVGRPELLEPCATSDYPTPAARPRYSVLATDRLERALGAPLPEWRQALERFLDQLRAEETATAAK